jgi:hypothetical protein
MAIGASAFGATGAVDSPTTSISSYVITCLSFVNKQELGVDGFGCILLQLTFSKA